MTIPVFITNQKKAVIEKRLAKFYSEINQAILLSELDNGPYSTWNDFERDSQLFYEKYLAKYLKVIKVIKPEDTTFIQLYFEDGSMAYMGYSKRLNQMVLQIV